MDGVHKPNNFAAVLRSCDAAGVFEAHGVWPAGTLNPSRHASGGAGKWVPIKSHRDTLSACDYLRSAGFRILAAHPSEQAIDYRDVDYTYPTALILGAELHGFSEQSLQLADQQIVIPMLGMAQSLNVSVAAATILFEAQRQRLAAGLYASRRLEHETYRRTLFEWSQPKIADYCRRHGKDYPPLDAHGEPAVEFRH